jgi:hypothetical protein
MAGRRITGFAQMLLAIGGFIASLIALVRIGLFWAQELLLPDEPGLYRSAIIGIAVFLAAWFWSLFTSLVLFRELK